MICQQITAIVKVEANHLANKYAREYNNAPGIPVSAIPVAFSPRIDAKKPPIPPAIMDIIKGLPSRKVTPNTAGSVIPRVAENAEG